MIRNFEIIRKQVFLLVIFETEEGTPVTMENGTKTINFIPGQNFETLKAFHLQALENSAVENRDQALFKDDRFPPNSTSLSDPNEADIFDSSNIIWKRASDLGFSPKFIVDGASRFDINQGRIGNCWVLASMGSLTLKKKLFSRVVPNDQSFGEDYAGIFHFQFWQSDRWVDVVVDDYLPTVNGKLCFITSKSENELWPALLEKAYAKLNGSYQGTDGGWPSRSLTDFTGGICEEYDLAGMIPDDLFKAMMKAQNKCALMTSWILPDPYEYEAETPEGLIRGKYGFVFCLAGFCLIYKLPSVITIATVLHSKSNPIIY